MSIIKRGAMALVVIALIAATVPAVVGSGDFGSETSSSIVKGPQHSSPQGALAVNAVTAQPGVTPEMISGMFQQVGVDAAIHADGSYEDPRQRVERITAEINAGLRTEAEVREAISRLTADQVQRSGQLQSTEVIVARIRGFFETAGVLIPTPIESEEDRLARIASQIASGERSFAEVQQTIEGIAAGRVGFNPDAPARFGGTGAGTIGFTIDGGTEVSIPITSGINSSPVVIPTTVAPAPTTVTTAAPKVLAVAPSTTTTASSTTTQPAPTTTTTQPPATKPVSGGVVVRAGESIQGAVDANPVGTTFVVKAGVHKGQSVKPKAGDTFVGEPGAVLDGGGVTEFAFGGTGADDVTIRGLVIEKYESPLQEGVIRHSGGAEGWVVEDNEVRNNGGVGIFGGADWKILRNYVHHNGQLGVKVARSGVLVADNEIAFNNTDNVDYNWEAGGAKFVETTNLVVRNNYVHDNVGPGLWTDRNNIGTVFEGNRVIDNAGPGIKAEKSYRQVVRNNVVEGNGFGSRSKGWVDGAGILVRISSDVEVYGNTVRFNNDGIAGIHAVSNHGTPKYGPFQLSGLWVHDNLIAMNVGYTGVVSSAGESSVWGVWNNRFDRNTYQLGSGSEYFAWQGYITTTDWKKAGQDPNGTWK